MPSDIVNIDKQNTLPAIANDGFSRESLQDWQKSVDTDARKIRRLVGLVVLFVFGFGGVWSVTAPLGGAIATSGRVVAEDRNRVVQHLEGGILKALHVREGSKVKAGDVVATLDGTQVVAQLQTARIEAAILRIQLARRRAEAAEQESVSFPTDFEPAVAANPLVQEALESEKAEFEASRRVFVTEGEILRDRIAGRTAFIASSKDIITALNEQEKSFETELVDLRELLEKGFTERPRVLAIERQLQNLQARKIEIRQDIARSEGEIQEFTNQLKQGRATYIRDANNQLVAVQRSYNQLNQQIVRLNDILVRGEIRSPVDGTVFQIGKRTLGAVLVPGDALMEIFPDSDTLTVEAAIRVTDISKVYVGQPVEVIFSNGNFRERDPFEGEITYVSADSLISEQNPVGAYQVHVSVVPREDKEIFPGSSAQVFIITEPKTFLEILVEPIAKFARKAFND